MAGTRISEASKKSRGRPPTYVWADHEPLTEAEKRLKISIEKRRERQKKSYYKKKTEKKIASSSSTPSRSPSFDYILDDFANPSQPSRRSFNSPIVIVREYRGP